MLESTTSTSASLASMPSLEVAGFLLETDFLQLIEGQHKVLHLGLVSSTATKTTSSSMLLLLLSGHSEQDLPQPNYICFKLVDCSHLEVEADLSKMFLECRFDL